METNESIESSEQQQSTTTTVASKTEDSQENAILDLDSNLAEGNMTSSMIIKQKISTEEEAKAALAERRKLVREQAERDAEIERQRLVTTCYNSLNSYNFAKIDLGAKY